MCSYLTRVTCQVKIAAATAATAAAAAAAACIYSTCFVAWHSSRSPPISLCPPLGAAHGSRSFCRPRRLQFHGEDDVVVCAGEIFTPSPALGDEQKKKNGGREKNAWRRAIETEGRGAAYPKFQDVLLFFVSFQSPMAALWLASFDATPARKLIGLEFVKVADHEASPSRFFCHLHLSIYGVQRRLST